jgi:hypothetical protein
MAKKPWAILLYLNGINGLHRGETVLEDDGHTDLPGMAETKLKI